MYDINVFSNLVAQVSLLAKQLQATQLQNTQESTNVVQSNFPSCEFCNGPYQSNGQPLGENYLGASPTPRKIPPTPTTLQSIFQQFQLVMEEPFELLLEEQSKHGAARTSKTFCPTSREKFNLGRYHE